jgi:hypothetical protein
MCDRSCGLSEQQYQERTQRLAELYNGTLVQRVNNTNTPTNQNEST